MSIIRKIASAVGSIIGRKVGDIFGQKLEATISSQSTDESDVEDEETIDTESESDSEKPQDDTPGYLDDISDAELRSLTNQLLDELNRRQSE